MSAGPAVALRASTVVLVLCAAVGCDSPPPTAEDAGNAPEPTLHSIQRQVFDVSCATVNCHLGHLPESQLNLVRGRSFAALVNISSTQVPDLMLVAPGDPDRSYLIHKLEGETIVGERMPNNAPPLSPETIAVVRAWIERGAPDR